MEFNVYAGQHVLYKKGHGWTPGTLISAELTNKGLLFSVETEEGQIEDSITENNLFLNSRNLTWEIDDPDTLISKDKFIEGIEDEIFNAKDIEAYVSDGKYAYYPVVFRANWIEKQPFNYIVWYNK
jgi:hypothetical protein